MTSEVKEMEKNEKLDVDIFVPLNACACTYEAFINRVFAVLMDYTKYINFQTKSIHSDEAHKLNLNSNCVVLDGNRVISNTFLLKKELPKILKEKGLI